MDAPYSGLLVLGWGGGGGVLGLIFAGYVPLTSQSPYAIIVDSVAIYRSTPSQSLLGKCVL